ncbi:MAG: hypothetical protein KUA37_17575 [Desulfomicrobium sp.]|nr:hypothetical protein [Pseudomonadota bacterium]MBV1713793.1 hypothetical protein [Desulfomicrobium sp.]MBU4572328.1 hypothetical protein [Pseudomonadota bacterium]MBU4594306.1 hypothetical protein [Pseudomonadota bacterium]MBV1719475.1 hypothetical protein [Desulfomicrobium sp.]
MNAEQHLEKLAALEHKLDAVTAMTREMARSHEMTQDLFKDLNIVGNAAMFSLQEELELENVHVDGRELRQLMILFLKNLHNFNYALRQFEALAELGQESYGAMRGMLMDYIEHATVWEQKGYFQSASKAVEILARMHESMPRDTLDRLEASAPEIVGLMSDLADPGLLRQARQLLKMQKYLLPALALAWIVPVGLLVLVLLK